VAAEGAHVTNPPRPADIVLRPFLRKDDAESVPGDLLEEYREGRLPTLGAGGANHWYWRQVLSVVWRALWPCLLAVSALRVVFFPLPSGWNPSLVPAPGVSVLDAILFVSVGYYGSRRSGQFVSGIIMSAITAPVGIALYFVYAAIRMPSLLSAPFEKPLIFVIIATVFAIGEGFAVATGAIGAATGRWLRPSDRRLRVS
jgi:hypothetical protein